MTRTFKNLETHYKVRIQVLLFQIQSWDNEKFYIDVDGRRYAEINSWTLDNPFHWCGNNPSWKSRSEFLDIVIPHTGPEMTIVFSSNLDEDAIN